MILTCSKKFGFDANLPENRRRLVMMIAPVDWAAEWLRPVTPNLKLVGPILSEPGKALPAELEVTSPQLKRSQIISRIPMVCVCKGPAHAYDQAC